MDDANFEAEANIAWLPYPYVKELAKKGGPFPRRQCLDQRRLIVGKVPAGRKIVVSHGWDTAFHISPNGTKMALIVEEMQRLIDEQITKQKPKVESRLLLK